MYGLDSEREAISVSLRHLKLFESVARLSSVRRASEECHLSQPAVTQAIAKLEEQIGTSLLERGASGSYLNPLGTIFHRRTERLFAQIEEALVELGVPAGQRPGDGEPHHAVADSKPDRHRRERVVRPGGARARRVAGDA